MAVIKFQKHWKKIILLSSPIIIVFIGISQLRSWRPTTLRQTGKVGAIAFSPTRTTIAIEKEDYNPENNRKIGNVVLWNNSTESAMKTFEGCNSSINSQSISFSPDGKTLLTDTIDGGLSLWNVNTGKLQWTKKIESKFPNGEENISEFIYDVAFSPNGKVVASKSYRNSSSVEDPSGTIRLWNADTGKSLGVVARFDRDSGSTIDFSPDGKNLAFGEQKYSVEIFDVYSKKNIKTLSPKKSFKKDLLTYASVKFSPKGDSLSSGGTDGVLRCWDVKSGNLIKEISAHIGAITSVNYSPDGNYIATGGVNGKIKLWNSVTGELQRSLVGHSGIVTSVSFASDGKYLASGSEDKTVKLWRIK